MIGLSPSQSQLQAVTDMMHQRQRVVSRVLYGSVYLVFFLVLLGLLLITPGDAIERSLSNNQKYNVLILIISYVVTVLIVGFVYILRLYMTKTAIAAIPRAWMPIDKGDVKGVVYRMIQSGLSRSAAIAFEAQPREQQPVDVMDGEQQQQKPGGIRTTKSLAENLGLPLPPTRPVWGVIEHHGWASPNSPDLPNVQYSSVVSELPNLIEAQAFTLASAEAAAAAGDGHGLVPGGVHPTPDRDIADLLQRTPSMTMRDYLEHLSGLGVTAMDETVTLFLSQYEYVRYANRPISSERFRELMNLFADVLRVMRPLELRPTNDGDSYSWDPSESDIDNEAPMDTNPPSPRSSSFRPSCPATPITTQHSHVVQRSPALPGVRVSSAQARNFRTAPTTPESRRTDGRLSRKLSDNSVVQMRRQSSLGLGSRPSNASLRSRATVSSGDSGSVIRLATRDDDVERLPYVLMMRSAR